ADPLAVEPLGQLHRRLEAEVSGHSLLETRAGATPILAAGRSRDGGEPDIRAATPVARDRSERGEARMAPVGRDPDAVDSRSAHHGNAPAAVSAGPEDGEGVVVDDRPSGPSSLLDSLTERALLARKVHARTLQPPPVGGL